MLRETDSSFLWSVFNLKFNQELKDASSDTKLQVNIHRYQVPLQTIQE
jgi:hypothetical protein